MFSPTGKASLTFRAANSSVSHCSTIPKPRNSRSTPSKLIELFGWIEPWRVVHRHFRAESAISLIRPVTDFAIADPDQIGQSIAAQVGESDVTGILEVSDIFTVSHPL